MGLDAYVPCRCFERGLTTDPPVDRSLIAWDDEDGFWWPKEVEGQDLDEEIRIDGLFSRWIETCCPHPRMNYVSEWVGNWPMVSAFRDWMERLDDGSITVLTSLLPTKNGGHVDPSLAGLALNALETLPFLIGGQTAHFLTDSATGQEVYDYVQSYGGRIRLGPISCGFDPDGLFIEVAHDEENTLRTLREGQTGAGTRSRRRVFQSVRVWQRVVDEHDGRPMVRWTGEDGAVFEAPDLGIGEGDRDWVVTSRTMVATDIPCVEPLRKLLSASVETGVPVYWS